MKVGVVGVGSMGMNHARVYSEIADLVGIADINEKSGKRITRHFGTKYFKNYHDLLPVVDALTIATPTNWHYRVAMNAIANGKHLLIEKPIASNVEEGEKLMNDAEEQGVVLAVGHIEQHNPIIKYVKKALKENKFGKIFFSGKRLGLYPPRIRDVGVIHNHFLMVLIGKNSMKMFL
jgi:UDP-N-acetylglucosamine 3-dehydrogenase